MDDANFSPPPAQYSASGGYSLYAKGGAAGQWRDSESHALHECWGISRSSSSSRSVPTPSPLHVDHEGGLSRSYPVFLPSVAFTFVFAGLPPLVELLAAWAWTYGCVGCRDRLSLPVFSLFVRCEVRCDQSAFRAFE
ncbi:hypothetical protein POTOM_042778 [Populus tomentosa]|uniref:Uncharacterized protein n=1 Tax=Populus tomentosa TaxID=118781 RepID=A0A8X7YNC6_POPTO|nr:hypothetical protein POTOM_042778 [Populus tomentosa]